MVAVTSDDESNWLRSNEVGSLLLVGSNTNDGDDRHQGQHRLSQSQKLKLSVLFNTSIDVTTTTTSSIVQVVSDRKHYESFLCGLCCKLVTLDCIVTNRCSHIFCRTCFEESILQQIYWNKKSSASSEGHRRQPTSCATTPATTPATTTSSSNSCNMDDDNNDCNVDENDTNSNNPANKQISCPVCQTDLNLLSPASSLSFGGNNTPRQSSHLSHSHQHNYDYHCHGGVGGMSLGSVMIAGRSLQESQPIAYKSLTLIQVKCHIGNTCTWIGDYGHYMHHMIQFHHSNDVLLSSSSEATAPTMSPSSTTQEEQSKQPKQMPTQQQLYVESFQVKQQEQNMRDMVSNQNNTNDGNNHRNESTNATAAVPLHQQIQSYLISPKRFQIFGGGNSAGRKQQQRLNSNNSIPSTTTNAPAVPREIVFEIMPAKDDEKLKDDDEGYINNGTNNPNNQTTEADTASSTNQQQNKERQMDESNGDQLAPSNDNGQGKTESKIISVTDSNSTQSSEPAKISPNDDNDGEDDQKDETIIVNLSGLPTTTETFMMSPRRHQQHISETAKTPKIGNRQYVLSETAKTPKIGNRQHEKQSDSWMISPTKANNDPKSEDSVKMLSSSPPKRLIPMLHHEQSVVPSSDNDDYDPKRNPQHDTDKQEDANDLVMTPLPPSSSLPCPSDNILPDGTMNVGRALETSIENSMLESNTGDEPCGSHSKGDYGESEHVEVHERIEYDLEVPEPTMIGRSRYQQHSSKQQHQDWDTSINSMGCYSENQEEVTEVDQSQSYTTDDDYYEITSSAQLTDDERYYQLIERAEKLKKQANAKFNKAKFDEARALYTTSINLMGSIANPSTATELKLLSNMHSNRAVTFFRERQYSECVEDCNMALKYEPTYDKSWIRKWRALMALGKLDDACTCLEEGSSKAPFSKKIITELKKVKIEKQVLAESEELFDKGELQAAKDYLRGHVVVSDNVSLLCFAALVDIHLGHTNDSIDTINKALRINPAQEDALELRSFAQFASGDSDTAIDLLLDAIAENSTNANNTGDVIVNALQRYKKIHSDLSEARLAVQDRLFDIAIEKFTSAIDESEPLPPLCQMYAILRRERAEVYIMSRNFLNALKDCQEVIRYRRDYAPVWVLRSEILLFLGKAEEAKKELELIRKTWGGNDPDIEDAYYRADFEMRINRVNNDVLDMITQLDIGTYEFDICDAIVSETTGKSNTINGLDLHQVSVDRQVDAIYQTTKAGLGTMATRRTMTHLESRAFGSDNVQLHLGPTEEFKKSSKDARRKKSTSSNDTSRTRSKKVSGPDDRSQSPVSTRRERRRRGDDTDRKKASRSSSSTDEYSRSARKGQSRGDETDRDRSKQSSIRARSSRRVEHPQESSKRRDPARGAVLRTASDSKPSDHSVQG